MAGYLYPGNRWDEGFLLRDRRWGGGMASLKWLRTAEGGLFLGGPEIWEWGVRIPLGVEDRGKTGDEVIELELEVDEDNGRRKMEVGNK